MLKTPSQYTFSSAQQNNFIEACLTGNGSQGRFGVVIELRQYLNLLIQKNILGEKQQPTTQKLQYPVTF